MGAVMIVIIPPGLQYRAHVVQRRKLVNVQTFVSKSSVERFDEAVLGGLARPYEVELHPSRVAPLVEDLATAAMGRVGRIACTGSSS